jgi:UDP-N-acetyl-D-mannosaminuronate dehydrogenase
MHDDTQKSDLPMLLLPRYARRINDSMAEYVVFRIEAAIGSLAHQSVLILGVAYRGDVREVAFTSAQLLQKALLEHGASVFVDDPLFSEEDLDAAGYVPLPVGFESKICAIILQTDHQVYRSFDFSRFNACRMVLDGRRVLCREHIEALGMQYIAIGDGSQTKKALAEEEQNVVEAISYSGRNR